MIMRRRQYNAIRRIKSIAIQTIVRIADHTDALFYFNGRPRLTNEVKSFFGNAHNWRFPNIIFQSLDRIYYLILIHFRYYVCSRLDFNFVMYHTFAKRTCVLTNKKIMKFDISMLARIPICDSSDFPCYDLCSFIIQEKISLGNNYFLPPCSNV